MSELADKFFELPLEKRKEVQIELCKHAYDLWKDFVIKNEICDYRDRATGKLVKVDIDLPKDAIASVIEGRDTSNVTQRYLEPVKAIKEGSLKFGDDDMCLAYFSVLNLYGKQIDGKGPSDWAVVYQALGSYNKSEFSIKLGVALENVA